MTESWASARDASVRVRASEHGVPTAIRIEPGELRYSGAELARTILDLCTRATERAKADRRILLERAGMDADILDRLGLPRADAVADAENERLESEPAVGWMKSV